MKHISKWSMLGLGIGAIWGLANFIRYYIIFPDMSEMVRGVLEGFIIMAISWLFNAHLQQDNRLTAVEDYLDEITSKDNVEVTEFDDGN